MAIYIRNKRKGIYWIRFSVKRIRIHESSGYTDKIKAQEYHDRRRLDVLDEIRLGRKPEYRWEDAAGEWLVQAEGKRSFDKDQEIIAWMQPYLEGIPLNAITREVLEKARSNKARESSKATANRYMALVRAILRKAAFEWDWMEKPPKIPMYKLEDRRVVTISREKAEELLSYLPAHSAAMARFSLETGLRRNNVMHLKWEQIDMQNRAAWIHGDEAKGKRAIPVPLTQAALSILRNQVGQHTEYVFVYQGKPVYQTATKAWRKACAKAGLQGLRWHDLRHVWASWLAQSGTPLMALQEMGGWQSPEMVRRYAHFAIDHLREYAERASAPQVAPSNVVQFEKKAK